MKRRELIKLAAFGAAGPILTTITGCSSETTEEPRVLPDPAVDPDGNVDVTAQGPRGASSLGAPRPDALSPGTGIRSFANDGRHFEVESLRNYVDAFDVDGRRLSRIGDSVRVPSAAVGALSAPVAVVWDAAGARLLILERGNERIQAFDASGRSLGIVASTERGADLAFDPAAREIYVCESNVHRIRVLDDAGKAVRTIGSFGTEGAGLNGPRSIALAPDGNVHVVDAGSASIKVFTSTGRFVGAYGTSRSSFGVDDRLVGPCSVRFDTDGRAWVADQAAPAVNVYDGAGRLLSRMNPRAASGRVASPIALAARPDGTMYAAVLST